MTRFSPASPLAYVSLASKTVGSLDPVCEPVRLAAGTLSHPRSVPAARCSCVRCVTTDVAGQALGRAEIDLGDLATADHEFGGPSCGDGYPIAAFG